MKEFTKNRNSGGMSRRSGYRTEDVLSGRTVLRCLHCKMEARW